MSNLFELANDNQICSIIFSIINIKSVSNIDISEFQNNANIKIVNAPIMEISSSFIRESIKSKKSLEFFMPEKVYKYIQEMHFYEK